MGSLISLIVPNYYMEDFETKAIKTSNYHPRVWRRYIVDILPSRKYHTRLVPRAHSFHQSLHPFYCGRDQTRWFDVFLDTLLIPEPDRTFSTTVYRKPTHTDQYLHWNSHHSLAAKYSVFQTMNYTQSRNCCSDTLLLLKEEQLNEALQRCKHPSWALNR